MSEANTELQSSFKLSHEKIQNRIDTLYDTKWYQPNACYPVVLGYTSSLDTTAEAYTTFFEIHRDRKVSNLKDYMDNLLNFCNIFTLDDGLAPDQVLTQFSKLTGLKSPNIPLSKNNGVLEAKKADFKNDTVVLEFLCDRDLKVLDYLQNWRNKWFVYNGFLRSFRGSHKGGEGFLGIANCNVDLEGTVTALSFLSIFGLIPISVDLPASIGPGTSDSSLQVIKTTCTYSNAVLVYPSKNSLNYYYYN